MRFSLKALLMLVTALVLLLGYAQHRRRWILATSDELTREGFVFNVPDAWHDRIWQRRPVVARASDGTLVYQAREGTFVATIISEDADQTLTKRLRALGVLEED